MRNGTYGKYQWKTKTCIICNNQFQPTGPHSNYCSLKCRFEDFPIDKQNDLGCWIWLGSKLPKGYGRTTWIGKHEPTHRLSWVCYHGPIPKGFFVCHRCHNPSCVNPKHLYLANHKKNMDDSRVLSRFAKKLTPKKVRVIKNLFKTKTSNRKIASMFGVSHSAIDKIKNNITWTHI